MFTSIVIPVIAKTGTLDPDFATKGTALISLGDIESANAIYVSPDDTDYLVPQEPKTSEAYIAGTTNALGNHDFALIKLTDDGLLDTDFSDDGGTTIDIGNNSEDFATCIDRRYISGYTNANSSNDFVTVCYDYNGNINTSFGSNGRVITDFGNDDRASCMVTQSENKILVAGSTSSGSSNFAIVRYNGDGTLDTSFSGDGRLDFDFGGDDFCQAMAVQHDGKIVLVGYTSANGTNDFAVARLTIAGELDSTFDADGKLTTSFGQDDRASSIVIQPDGAIVAAGSSDGGAADFAIARYSGLNGAPDISFSEDGKQTINFGNADFCNALVRQLDGKLLLGGYTNQSGNNDFALARLEANGDLDPHFAKAGKKRLDLSNGGNDQIKAMALQVLGKPVIVGVSQTDMAAVRLNTRAITNAYASRVHSLDRSETLSSKIPKSGGKQGFIFVVANEGHEPDSFNIRGTMGNSDFIVEYFNGEKNVTNAVNKGTFNTGSLPPTGRVGHAELRVRVTAKTRATNKKLSVLMTATSVADPNATDTITIKATSK